jgi:hypothetical protein
VEDELVEIQTLANSSETDGINRSLRASASRLVNEIERAIRSGSLDDRFRPREVRQACPGFANQTYPVFLSNHRVGNPFGYTEYFHRNGDGTYSLA